MPDSTRISSDAQNKCPFCDKPIALTPAVQPGDAACPHCNSLVWFPNAPGSAWNAGFPVYTLGTEEAATKEQAIRSLVSRLAECACFLASDSESIVASILMRERLGSSGVGGAVAIPHTSRGGITRIVGAVAKIPDGVDFDSIDGQLVRVICLLISPVDRPGDHLRALEAVHRSLRGVA